MVKTYLLSVLMNPLTSIPFMMLPVTQSIDVSGELADPFFIKQIPVT